VAGRLAENFFKVLLFFFYTQKNTRSYAIHSIIVVS